MQKEKDVVILAHYYVDGAVQEIADYVGDSFYLSKVATQVTQQNILFCGVSFMGESAKILNPEKNVVMADAHADCPMAHMVTVEQIEQVRKENPDVAVVCYVNSTAEIKAVSDVCVTSSNAVKVVKNLPEQNIFFVPDNNLGRYVAKQLPEKHFIFHDGFCHVHKSIHAENVKAAKEAHPEALVLAHPECKSTVLKLADVVGSTAALLKYAVNHPENTYIVATESGILHEMQKKCPQTTFIPAPPNDSTCGCNECSFMRLNTLEKLYECLKNESPEITVDPEIAKKAVKPIQRMLEISAKLGL